MTASITPTIPSTLAPDDQLVVFGLPLTAQLPPRICRSSDDTCPTYGGEMCPDDQALVDKCQHC